MKGRYMEVILCIESYLETRKRMPTTKELCQDIKIQRGSLQRILANLVKNGWLTPLPLGTMRFQYLAPAVCAGGMDVAALRGDCQKCGATENDECHFKAAA